jgi:transposase-like protein
MHNRLEITEQQLKAATMLVNGIRCTDVARDLGVTKATISAWRVKPEFMRLTEALQVEVVEDMRASLRALRDQAIEVISGIMSDASAPAAVRLKGALAILDKIDSSDPRTRPPMPAPELVVQDEDAVFWNAVRESRERKAAPGKQQMLTQ